MSGGAPVGGTLGGVPRRLRAARWVDLTHRFAPGQPSFPGDPDETVETVSTVADGAWVQRFGLIGQWGTHVDAPALFAAGGRTLAELPVRDTVLPLVVLPLADVAQRDVDLEVTAAHITAFEAEHGRIPEGSFVALATGWSRRWNEPGDAMHNPDTAGVFHSPGWGVSALEALAARGVVAVGHETCDADPGVRVSAGDLRAQRWWLEHDGWMIESMKDLRRVPPTGAVIVATWPVPEVASGFPARTAAVLPVSP